MLVDSHCHLDFPEFADDLAGVVDRAEEAGVGAFLTICTHLTRFRQVRAVAADFANMWCTAGIHPHNAGSEPVASIEELLKIAEDPKVVAFGETGLDFFYDHSPRDRQEESFRTHIAAARESGLPVVIHTRDADERMVDILRDESARGAFPGVVHCFSSGRILAEAVLELGLYISISGIVTFKKAEELRDTVRDVPIERLLVETDAPYLAPVPKRGKCNEPAYTAYTAAAVAELKRVPEAEFSEISTANFFRLFSKARPVPGGEGVGCG